MFPLFFAVMITKAIEQKIPMWLEPRLKAMDLFFVNARIQPGNKIQVFVDGMQNITIDQCAELSKWLETFLDADDTLPSNYTLEVSSPGMDNPMQVPQQYQKRIGRLLDINLANGERFSAVLTAATETDIDVQVQAEKKQEENGAGQHRHIPYTEIKKCIVQFKF